MADPGEVEGADPEAAAPVGAAGDYLDELVVDVRHRVGAGGQAAR